MIPTKAMNGMLEAVGMLTALSLGVYEKLQSLADWKSHPDGLL
jgi:hypothetical protein